MRHSTDAPTLWLPGMSPDTPVYQPLSLRDYFDQSFLPSPSVRDLSSSRINELKLAIFRFIWWSEKERRTSRPSLRDVTAAELNRFRDYCIDREIPGQNGKLRPCTSRALNKTLQALEQVLAAALGDGTLDDSRGITKIRKVAGPRQIGKLILPDSALSRLFAAADTATWPQRSPTGRALNPRLLWRVAIILFTTYGMRTQDLMRFDPELRPIRWGCVIPPGQSPAEDGICESQHGWLYWVPNKTRSRKDFAMTLPLNGTVKHWLDRWREAMSGASNPADPLMPIPACQKSLYGQWKRLLAAAEIKPKPKRTFDADGTPIVTQRNYLIKHLRCTAGTRAEEHGAAIGHPGIGRWVTGHISNDIFERHYRGQERALMQVLESLPQPAGFNPTQSPSSARPTLRVVG